jgi:hypothetical protein
MLCPGATMKKFFILSSLAHVDVLAMHASPGRLEKVEI